MNRVVIGLKQLARDIISTTVSLFKIMIPMIILIKIADEFGGITLLGHLLEPLMSLLGLPGTMALVWATTMLTNLYTGIMVLVNTGVDLSVAQITVLSTLMLFTHALPVEGIIAKKAGVPVWSTVLVRIGGGILFAWLQHLYFMSFDVNAHTAVFLWDTEAHLDENLLDWSITQIEGLLMIFVIIAALISLLRLMKILKIEHLIALLMMPLLKLLKVGKAAANLAVIGITLGLSYGGGLIISETKKGTLTRKDAYITVMLLNILHSMFEDTALVLLIGADINVVLWTRIVFTISLIAIVSQIYTYLEKRNIITS
ncbi:nucleoside recognition domain-containing protein [Shewanella intestini]|uniref:Nucleoside transporter/FeoB GTPase Gate domain-containing protein n=1 Tax=Shewanella intestini TaxID=2017544 RepID=A0ABS5HZZ8_9GAMM|nr:MULTISPECIES: nucleoside recognition domain-containing protein [Shewanella]MBR9727359.1 hypothetical protein [Shewanella intestini]MRG35591.1 hypothetical protein [Shewanella sp. XMDDZSB0408]